MQRIKVLHGIVDMVVSSPGSAPGPSGFMWRDLVSGLPRGCIHHDVRRAHQEEGEPGPEAQAGSHSMYLSVWPSITLYTTLLFQHDGVRNSTAYVYMHTQCTVYVCMYILLCIYLRICPCLCSHVYVILCSILDVPIHVHTWAGGSFVCCVVVGSLVSCTVLFVYCLIQCNRDLGTRNRFVIVSYNTIQYILVLYICVFGIRLIGLIACPALLLIKR